MVSLYFSDLAEGSTTPEPPPKGQHLLLPTCMGNIFLMDLLTSHGLFTESKLLEMVHVIDEEL